jgi:hypothetical protein
MLLERWDGARNHPATRKRATHQQRRRSGQADRAEDDKISVSRVAPHGRSAEPN